MASIMKRMMMRGVGIALMLLMATTAWAEDYLTGVDYLTWSDSEKKLVPAKTPEGVKVWILDGNETTLGTAGTSQAPTEAWYIAKGNLSYDHQLAGAKYCDIHLILEDGCDMSVDTEESPIGYNAIRIKDASLTIYGQSTGEKMGKLTVISQVYGIYVQGNSQRGLTVNGGQVTAKGVRALSLELVANKNITSGITINGGKVTATGTECGIEVSNNNDPNSKAFLSINGGEVYATNSAEEEPCIFGTEVTITGGHVEAKNNHKNGIAISGNEITITGGQVEAIGGSNGDGIFNGNNDITLGWTDPTDFINASSYRVFSSRSVKIAAGKRFVAYNPVGEGETELAASGIIGDATSTAPTTISSDDLSTIKGKTLRPFDGYRLQVEAKGITPSGYNREFTLTTGSGANAVTTHYYVYKADDNVTLTLPSLGQDYVSLTTRAVGESDDATNDLAVTTADNVATATLAMPAKDVIVTGMKSYDTGVKYLDWDDSKKKLVEATTPEGTKVWILDGTETTLGTAGTASAPTEAWYIAKGNLSYDHHLKNADFCNIHLILADGCNMSVNVATESAEDVAIFIEEASFTIYSQSTGEDMGSLTATCQDDVSIRIASENTDAKFIINCGHVTATSEDGIWVQSYDEYGIYNATLTINGGTLTATGTNRYGIEVHSEGAATFTVNDGQVTATGDDDVIYVHSNGDATFTVNDGQVTATTTATDGERTGIEVLSSDGAATFTVNDGIVEAVGSTEGKVIEVHSKGDANITITGGHVTAIGEYPINAYSSEADATITITGGQVEATGDDGGIDAISDDRSANIILGWTNADDYIYAKSFFLDGTSETVKTADGKRFVAYIPTGDPYDEGFDPTATGTAASGIIGDVTSTAPTTISSADLSTIKGKTLRPIDGYLLQVEPKDITPSGYNRDFTLTTGSGANAVTTHYYVYKADDDVTLTLPSLGQSGVLLATRAAGETADAFAYLNVTTTDNVATATLPMSTGDLAASDFTIKSARYYATGVNYLDWDDSKKKLVEKNTATDDNDANDKVWILDGTETTLGTAGTSDKPTKAWYIAKGNLSYDHQLKNASHCDIHLILADGCDMTVGTEESPIVSYAPIYVSQAALAIYGQSTGDNMGKLNAIGYSCGIYVCRYFGKTPDLTINGGQITARGYYAINTFIEDDGSIGGITINGGKVTANGTGSGIYASGNGSSTISILTINGGEVYATNSDENEGSINSDDHIIITGGHVEAKNNHNYGTAIDCYQSMTITGGQVEATGGSKGYGLYTFLDDITFGWTDYSDYIKANSYCPGFINKDVKLVEGKYFLIEGTNTVLGSADADYVLSDDDLEAVKGKKLLPIVGMSTGGVKYLAFTDNDGNRKLAGDDVQVYVVTGYDLAKGKVYLKAVEGNVIPKGLPVVIGSKTEDGDLPADIFILGGDDSQTTVEGLLKNYVSCDGTQTVQAYLDALFGEGASLSEYIPYLLTGGMFKSVDVKATDVIKKDVCLLFIPKWDVLMGKSAGTTNAGTRSIGIGNGEATSLTPVPSPTGEGSDYYDLQGRKISKPTKKGIYIYNGKKVAIK